MTTEHCQEKDEYVVGEFEYDLRKVYFLIRASLQSQYCADAIVALTDREEGKEQANVFSGW